VNKNPRLIARDSVLYASYALKLAPQISASVATTQSFRVRRGLAKAYDRRAASPAAHRRHAHCAGAAASAARAAIAELEILAQADANLAQARAIAIDRDAGR
jgi:hypothetical protein